MALPNGVALIFFNFKIFALVSLQPQKKKKKKEMPKYFGAPEVLDVLTEQTLCSNKYWILYINSPMKNSALALIIHHLFTECFS